MAGLRPAVRRKASGCLGAFFFAGLAKLFELRGDELVNQDPFSRRDYGLSRVFDLTDGTRCVFAHVYILPVLTLKARVWPQIGLN